MNLSVSKATTATIRAHLICVPGRLARSARQHTLHLPTGWPWANQWTQMATTATAAARNGPPTPT